MPPPAKIKKVENVFEELIKAMKAPVEFDLPSALKEWKLGYYIPIKRNVYLTKRRIEDDGIFCSCTPTSGSTVACDKDCQCGMLFSCCSSNCKCDNKCANKSFQHRPLKKTKLITTEKCGFGLVAEDEIKKGEFVIEYVGEVIDDRTCEERLWKMKRQRDTNFYLCEVSSNMVIDATNKGNMSRFINHSCEPNTEMQKWTVDGETRVGIFALRDIKEGEELTYDYKFVQFGADQDCHCGSSNCRKMLGTTKPVNSIVLHNGNSGSSQDQHVVKKRKTTSDNCIGEIIRLWHRRDKMYVPAVIYGFNEYTKMHTLMFDVDITEEFDMREEDWDFLPVAAKYGLDLQPLSPCCGLPVIGGVTALRATKVWLTTSRLLLQFPTCVPHLLRKNGLVVVLVEDEEEMVWAAGHATFMVALGLGWDEST